VRSVPEILEDITVSIRHIYSRPSMWASTPDGLDSCLWCHHYIWAFIHEREKEFRTIHSQRLDELKTQASFSFTFSYRNPNRSEDECRSFVLENWKIVSTRLGISLTPSNPVESG